MRTGRHDIGGVKDKYRKVDTSSVYGCSGRYQYVVEGKG